MLMGVLAHIGSPEEEDDRTVQSIIGTLMAALPSGGYLAIYDSSDADPGLNDALDKYNESGATPTGCAGRIRSRYFDGLDWSSPAWCRSSSGALTIARSTRPRT